MENDAGATTLMMKPCHSQFLGDRIWKRKSRVLFVRDDHPAKDFEQLIANYPTVLFKTPGWNDNKSTQFWSVSETLALK